MVCRLIKHKQRWLQKQCPAKTGYFNLLAEIKHNALAQIHETKTYALQLTDHRMLHTFMNTVMQIYVHNDNL